MRLSIHSIIAIACFVFVYSNIFSQSLPDSTTKKIDSIFKNSDNYNSPGYAVGIVRNDSLIFSKGYGMANLEYNVRISPETIFHMASVSKQFTAFSIVLLARQGKLNLDDDIRKYLSWFPDLKEKITIRNLLNHTSGIRDQWQMLAISGTRLDDVITQDQIIKILSKQQALNFKPGDQYSYSNSGFTMLAEIVKSVTGQTLRQFTDSAIFKPLGMMNTHFHDDYTEIVKNRSYSYDSIDSLHYANSILSYSTAGATSLFTNINDMSKWIMNFYDHKVGDQKDIDQLTQKGRLNNGKELDYALGISVNTYNGYKVFSHNGADAGYRTIISILPDQKMGFIVFSNLAESDPWNKAYSIAALFFPDNSKKVSESKKTVDSSNAVMKDSVSFKKYTGDYISEDGVQFGYAIQHGKMYWKTYGQTYLLLKDNSDTFLMATDPTVKFVFNTDANKDMIVDEFWPDNSRHPKKYLSDLKLSDDQLKKYAGTYFCPELDCKYGIILKDHQLVLTNDKYNDVNLKLAGTDDLFTDFWWMSHLQIARNNRKQITGFEVNSGRVMHLWFKKIE